MDMAVEHLAVSDLLIKANKYIFRGRKSDIFITVSLLNGVFSEKGPIGRKFLAENQELNYLRMNYRFEKIKLFHCMNLGSISLIIREEHGMHCMPCSS